MRVVHDIGADRRRESPLLLAALILLASVFVAETPMARQGDARAVTVSAPVYTSTSNAITAADAKAPAALRTNRLSVRAARYQTSAGSAAAVFLGPTVPQVTPPLSSGIALDSPYTPSCPDAPGGVGIRAPPSS